MYFIQGKFITLVLFSDMYDKNILPKHMRTPEGYNETVYNIDNFDDFKHHFDLIVKESSSKFQNKQQLCEALEEFTKRTSYHFHLEHAYFLMVVCYQFLAEFFKKLLCTSSDVQVNKEENGGYCSGQDSDEGSNSSGLTCSSCGYNTEKDNSDAETDDSNAGKNSTCITYAECDC